MQDETHEPHTSANDAMGDGPERGGSPASAAEGIPPTSREEEIRRELGVDGERLPRAAEVFENRVAEAISGYEAFVASVRSAFPAGTREDRDERSGDSGSAESADECGRSRSSFSLLRDIRVPVQVELGRTQLPLREVLQLGSGSVIELDRGVEDPFDLRVNGEPIARGEILVLDRSYCLRITEVLGRDAGGRTGEEPTC